MPGQTPIYTIPYPLPADAVVDYPALGLNLANRLEAIIKDLYAGPACRVRTGAAVVIPSQAGASSIPFTAEDFDPANMHDPVTNNNMVTIPKAGIYVAQFSAIFTTGAAAPAAPLQNYIRMIGGSAGVELDVTIPFSTPGVAGQQVRAGATIVTRCALNSQLRVDMFNQTGQSITLSQSAPSSAAYTVAWVSPFAATVLAELLGELLGDEAAPALEELELR